MTKRKSKSTKSTVKATAAKGAVKKSSAAPATTVTPPLIVLGYDDDQKLRGARFDHDKPDLVTKAADLLGFKVYEASPEDVAEYAEKLPLGQARLWRVRCRRPQGLLQNRLLRREPHVPLSGSGRSVGHQACDHDHAGRRVLTAAVQHWFAHPWATG